MAAYRTPFGNRRPLGRGNPARAGKSCGGTPAVNPHQAYNRAMIKVPPVFSGNRRFNGIEAVLEIVNRPRNAVRSTVIKVGPVVFGTPAGYPYEPIQIHANGLTDLHRCTNDPIRLVGAVVTCGIAQQDSESGRQ